MTDTPPPRRAGSRKTLGFLVGGFVLLAAVAVAFFADRTTGTGGTGMAPPAATTAAPAPVANPAEPAAPTPPASPAPAN